MKILHVASFSGNIGDNASHAGLKKILSHCVPDFEITRVEIRKFYQNYKEADRRRFDEQFVREANTYDLLIIGGGSFLDYWLPNSATGTTVDIDLEVLKTLTVPTLMTSVGCIPHNEVPDGNIEKFRRFLDTCLSMKNIGIALRCDGSVESIRNEIGVQYLSQLPEIADNGFFYDVVGQHSFPITNYIALNITDDQIHMKRSATAVLDENAYYAELATVVQFIINQLGRTVVLVPHIYSDLRAISKLLAVIPDRLVRNNVMVAPCLQGDPGTHFMFNIYKQSDMVIGTRLHANICSLAMGVPAVGLTVLDRVQYLYDYIGIPEQACAVTPGFSSTVIDTIQTTLQTKEQIQTHMRGRFDVLRTNSLEVYTQLLRRVGAL